MGLTLRIISWGMGVGVGVGEALGLGGVLGKGVSPLAEVPPELFTNPLQPESVPAAIKTATHSPDRPTFVQFKRFMFIVYRFDQDLPMCHFRQNSEEI
jgi:hypothetical protein